MEEQTHKFTNKFIYTESGSFVEKTDDKGEKKLYYESEILPFGKVSRNGVRYNEARARERGNTLVGKNLFFNHKTSGNSSEDLPRGEWEEVWFTKEAMHARAEVFKTEYNKDFVDYLKAAKNIKSSLNVSGEAKQRNEKATGKNYREAFIDEYLEASVVGIPGFDNAKGSLMASMSEAFGDDNMEEANKDGTGPNGEGPKTGQGKGDCEQEAIKPGEYKTKGGEKITVHSVSDGKAVISGNDSKNKSIDLDALKGIIVSESLEENITEEMEAAMKDIQAEIEDLQSKGKNDKFIINSLMKKYKLDKNDVKDLMGEFFESLDEIRTNVLENK